MRLPRLSLRKAGALPIPATYPAIRLRISVPSGVVVDADSEHLYYSATFGMIANEVCGPHCRPGCDEHGWLNLIPGDNLGVIAVDGLTEFSTVPVKIEIKPVRLADAGAL